MGLQSIAMIIGFEKLQKMAKWQNQDVVVPNRLKRFPKYIA
jgi:hypothetical protein